MQCTPFSGTFNGNGNVIANLTISSTAAYAGLFGQSSGTIENVGLIGETVSDDQALHLLAGSSALSRAARSSIRT